VSATAALKVGDPLDEECDVGPMIDESEAIRGGLDSGGCR
jgi:acyl-CoA reductase-like NAD-dependent aldehyde dehydrogenase